MDALLQMPRDTRPTAVARKDAMARIRVTSRSDNQVIPGGYILPKGVSECLVYMPDLPTIMAMIEPEPDAIKQAETFFLRAVEQEIKDELRDISDDEGKRARLIRARQEYSGSIEGTFFFLHKRDILPLESVEILQKDLPAPAVENQFEQQSFLATTIAREVAQALASVLPSVIAAAVQGAQQQQSKSSGSTK